jgi:pilus assembly protein CpaC
MLTKSGPGVLRLLFVILMAAACTRQAVADESPQLPADNDPLIRVTEPETDLRLVEKFAKILELKNRIATASGFDPEVLSVMKVDLHPNQIRIHALAPGVTSLVLVDEKNHSFTLEVFVIGDVRHLQAYIKNLFPHDAVTAIAVRDSVVLRGYVSRPEHIPRLMDIAKEFYPNVLNQMEVGGNQEVQLRIKVIEVDRTKIRALGFNFVELTQNGYLASTPGALAPLATLATPLGGPADPEVVATTLSKPTFLGGIISNGNVFNSFIEALMQESLLKILASPTLTTTNGQPANMLSGGQFPILVPQSLGTVTIQWKEFGVRLTAVPLLLGDGRVRLNLSPEVSQKDLSNAVTVNGLTVPGLTTRRVNTSVEMRFGETFMLAGLIEIQDLAQTFKTPLLGELPWIGAAFRRVSYQEVETELVILVTPVLAGAMAECQVPPGAPGMFSDTPTDRELYGQGLIEVPSYGDHCANCGPYPPPMMNLDGSNRGGSPMIRTVPVQELPPIRERMYPMTPTGPVTPPIPPAGSPALQVVPPATNSGEGGQNNSSASRWRYPKFRQVGAQSTSTQSNRVQQADFTTNPSAAGTTRNATGGAVRNADGTSAAPPPPSTQSSRIGLYEPQSGLYVPSSSGNP